MDRRVVVPKFIGEGAQKHLTRAINLAQSVIDLADSTGSSQSRFMKLPEFTLHCRVTEQHCYLTIEVASGEVEVLSGFIDGGLYRDGGCDSFYPSSEQAQQEKLDLRSYRIENKLGDFPQQDLVITAFGIPYTEAGTLCASMYSGRIRKVVQVALGIKGKQIKYDYRPERTHGLFHDPNGKPWIIEISKSYGVLACPLPIYGKLKKPSKIVQDIIDDLGYLPTGDALPEGEKLAEAVASGAVRILAPSNILDSFYEKSPFDSDCGWAFNDSGNEAQNTCYDQPNVYKMAYRYKVAIQVDDFGAPITATCSMVESGFLFNQTAGSRRFQVPRGGNSFQCFTFDTMAAGGFPDWPASSWSSPLIVYYNGNDEVVYRQTVFGGNGGSQDEIPVRSLSSSAIGSETGFIIVNQQFTQVPMCLQEGGWGKSFVERTNGIQRAVIGFSGPGCEAEYDDSWDRVRSYLFEVQDSPYYSYASGQGPLVGTQGKNPKRTFTIDNNGVRRRYNGICRSPRNRCGVFIGNQIARSSASQSIEVSESFIGQPYTGGTAIYIYNDGTTADPKWKATSPMPNLSSELFTNPKTGNTVANTAPAQIYGFNSVTYSGLTQQGLWIRNGAETQMNEAGVPSLGSAGGGPTGRFTSTTSTNTSSSILTLRYVSDKGSFTVPGNAAGLTGQWPDSLGNYIRLASGHSEFYHSGYYTDYFAAGSPDSTANIQADGEPMTGDIRRGWVGKA